MKHFKKSELSYPRIGKLNLAPAPLSMWQWRDRLEQLEDLRGYSDDEVDALCDESDFVLAARTRVEERTEENVLYCHDRIVGLMAANTRKAINDCGQVLSERVLNIEHVTVDPAYAGAAEWWLMDRISDTVRSTGQWTHVTVATLLGDSDSWYAKFAQRHGFDPLFVKEDVVVWGLLPEEDVSSYHG